VARNTRTLTFDLFAKNNTKKAFGQVGKDANSMGRTLSKVGVGVGIAFAAAAAGVIKAGFDAVEALKRIEVIGAQTNAVIKSTGGVANVTAAQIVALADSLEATTATEAEAVQEGANLLLTFTNLRNGAGANEKIFDRATGLMVDMARAMGTDAKSGAIQLGKALNNPVEGIAALSRVGVQFTDDQEDMIRSLSAAGDIMGAQTIILDELQSQFGGSGAAYAATFAGQIDTLNNNLGATAESIVIKLMPVLEDALAWMNGDGLSMLGDFADWFTTDGVAAIEAFVEKVGELAEEGTLVPTVVAGLAAITLGQIGLNAAMAANPLGLVILALAIVAGQFAWVLSNLEDFKLSAENTSWGTPFLAMLGGWVGMVAFFAQNWDGIWYVISSSFVTQVNGMITVINFLLAPLQAVLDVINQISGSTLSVRIAPVRSPLAPVGYRAATTQAPSNNSQGPGNMFLAAGGIVQPTPGGTRAVIGEGGQAEAVIPLSASSLARYGLGGGGGVTINVSGTVTGSREELARVVVRAIEDAKRSGVVRGGALA